jgi:hypothetical protein
VRISKLRIAWPIGRMQRATSFVLYGDLARAVRREAACAIMHWWGVSAVTVRKWRRALGVEARNDGDRMLIAAYNNRPKTKAAFIRRTAATAHDPSRTASIAAAKRGQPRPPHVIEAMRRANKGRKLSAGHRQKLSEAQRRRGVRPPACGRAWEPLEKTLLRTLRPSDAATRTGRTLQAVFVRRHKLGLTDGRVRRER